jgi:hypothetical protein
LAKGTAELPWDLHPRLADKTLVGLAADPAAWPRPKPETTTILVGADQGAGTVFESADQFVPGFDSAAVLQWNVELKRGLDRAKDAGATLRPLTTDAVLTTIEGDFGPHVQLVGHVVRNAVGDETLVCDNGDLNLAVLLRRVLQLRERGFRSPLRSIDLSTCVSSGAFSAVFHAVGVWCVASRPDALHPAWVARGLRIMYEQQFLDGRSAFHHAWIRAFLHESRRQ